MTRFQTVTLDETISRVKQFRLPVRKGTPVYLEKVKGSQITETPKVSKQVEPKALENLTSTTVDQNIISAEVESALQAVSTPNYHNLEAFWTLENMKYHENDALKTLSYRFDTQIMPTLIGASGNRIANTLGIRCMDTYLPMARALESSKLRETYMQGVKTALGI